jgi:hypothetical protein
MLDDIALNLHASRLDHRVALEGKYFTLIQNFTLENLCAFGWQLGSRWLGLKYVAPVHRGRRASV